MTSPFERLPVLFVAAVAGLSCAHGGPSEPVDGTGHLHRLFLDAVATANGRVESVAGVRLGESPESIELRVKDARRARAPNGPTRLSWSLGKDLPFVEATFEGGRAVKVMVASLSAPSSWHARDRRLKFCREYFALADELAARWGPALNLRKAVCEGEPSRATDLSTSEWRLGDAHVSLAVALSNFGDPGLVLSVENAQSNSNF